MSIVDFLFPPVDAIVEGYLAPGEEIIHHDKPAFGEFVLLSITDFLLVGGLVAISLYFWVTNRIAIALIAFVLADALVIRLVTTRIKDFYTRYVITDLRIMRISGVFSRVGYSIPLGKITDVAYKQRWWEQPFGYATIEIDSASEKSGLDRLRGLRDPNTFNRILLAMVADKQGFVVPGTASVNKLRGREDQLKLFHRFNRPLPEFFSEASPAEDERARLGVQRDLDEREERRLSLARLRRLVRELEDEDGDVFTLDDITQIDFDTNDD